MKTLIITGITAIVLLSIAIARYRRSYCRYCGAKMQKFYDIEEDDIVYQCPNCGRTYII